MCCAVENPCFSQKMGFTSSQSLSYALPMKIPKMKVGKYTTPERNIEKKGKGVQRSLKTGITETGAKPKITRVDDSKKSEKKKNKKWKRVPLTDLGFSLSLFPRPTRPELIDPEEERIIIEKIESEIEEHDTIVEKYRGFDSTETERFEGNCKKTDKHARADRDRKVRKAGRQVKDKYCTSIKNNKGRKKLFIHHRLFKLIDLEVTRLTHYLPSQSSYKNIDLRYSANKSSSETKSRLKPYSSIPVRNNDRPAPVQNLHCALQRTNAAPELGADLVNVLISLQHRDLTPEDYDLLLQLDESVAPKTVDKSLLNIFKTDTVDETCAGDICAVCMDAYEIGQNRKFLPCNHVFHAKCIDMWLENSSRNCPIDGLPVDDGS